MGADKKNRLLKAYEHLRSCGIVHTQNDVAGAMNANKTNVSYAFNGNEKYLTDKFLNRFNKAFDEIFEIEWLQTGKGEMLKCMSETNTQEHQPGEQVKIDFSALIRVSEKTAEAVQTIANSNEKIADAAQTSARSAEMLAKTNAEMWQTIKGKLDRIEELLEKKGGNAQGRAHAV